MVFYSKFPVLASVLLSASAYSYTLKDDYTKNNFANFFGASDFWTAEDPTHGYVDYVNQQDAWSNGLIGNGGNIYLGVDHKNVASGRGRKSVRLTSKPTYSPGTLFVADIADMVNNIVLQESYSKTDACYSQRPAAHGPLFGQRRLPDTGPRKERSTLSSKRIMPNTTKCPST
jgi:hypothetical protein